MNYSLYLENVLKTILYIVVCQPFANIFINPDSKVDEYGDDLFPEDFIVSLESPDSYIGAEKIFNSDNRPNLCSGTYLLSI